MSASAEPGFDSQITDEFPPVLTDVAPQPQWLFRTVDAGTDLLEELLRDGWEPIGSEVRQSARSYKMSGAFDYWRVVHLRKFGIPDPEPVHVVCTNCGTPGILRSHLGVTRGRCYSCGLTTLVRDLTDEALAKTARARNRGRHALWLIFVYSLIGIAVVLVWPFLWGLLALAWIAILLLCLVGKWHWIVAKLNRRHPT